MHFHCWRNISISCPKHFWSLYCRSRFKFCFILSQMVSQMFEFLATSQAEDGFFLNLSTLLLKMCQRFMDPLSPKLLKINPQYCAVPVGSNAIGQESTGLHVVGLDSETRLVAPPDEEQITLKMTNTFGFVTECFFMTHHCLSIGKWMNHHTLPLF